MKTFNKNMSIIIGDGYNDSCSLLTIKSNDSKDIIKDLISVLPNVLVLNVSDLDEKPIFTGQMGDDKGCIETKNYYNCFDMYRMKEIFMNVIVIEREWVHVNDDGTIGSHISNETEYRLNYNDDDDFAMSIALMVGNYYKHSKTARFEVTTPTMVKTPYHQSNEDLIKQFPDLKEFITDDSIHFVFHTDSKSMNLDNKKIIDRVMEALRPKFTVVIPVTNSEKELKVESGVKKTFIDSYDVYSMDSTIGKLFEMMYITSSTIGDTSGFRNDVIDEYVIVKCTNKDISSYGMNLLQNTLLIVNSELSDNKTE